ncbi:hypothetical protein J3S90_12520 [Flavobacterium sp. P4023]|uniref:Phage abortive infection protein n=1 Tax=Flavobacterium flabelliforme TaxID=2816119 RepID=A0ABS5CVK0_9FLAO|nr:putative phage abortive infection protein [Flavobacterium flabelliforme]MBP4142625.1 hypothetical protein [Flavobacterium flabelliforme]
MAISLDLTNEFIINTNLFTADYAKIGPYGDLIGGIMNPIVAFIGIIAASLAFYVQYVANKQVQNEFKIQQFESQFYEMLKLIKEEISTIYLPLNNGDTLLGRKVFYELDKEIKLIYFIVDNILATNIIKIKIEIAYYIFYRGRLKYYNRINYFKDKYNLDLNELLEIELFLSSIYEFLKSNTDHTIDIPTEVILDNVLDGLNGGGRLNDLLDLDANYHFAYLLLKNNENLNLNHLPFKGMETKLSLILRQLFSLVKFVANVNTINYLEKRNYLRVLRSILSNYEQLHIFYNWYSGTGSQWEDNKNKFLTDYRMIHNLPPDFLIEGLDLETIFTNRNFEYEENRKLDDSLFEQIEIFSVK